VDSTIDDDRRHEDVECNHFSVSSVRKERFMPDQSVTVQYPHVSNPDQPGAKVSFPDAATASTHAGTAWKALQTEDADEINDMLAAHIKATHHVMVRILKHLHTAIGPGGIAAPPEGMSQEDRLRMGQAMAAKIS
jgi:hypothetical protein